MPYPDSEYPSILRGRDKRESQRLLAAAPHLLAAAKSMEHAFYYGDGNSEVNAMRALRQAIAAAEGRRP